MKRLHTSVPLPVSTFLGVSLFLVYNGGKDLRAYNNAPTKEKLGKEREVKWIEG